MLQPDDETQHLNEPGDPVFDAGYRLGKQHSGTRLLTHTELSNLATEAGYRGYGNVFATGYYTGVEEL